MKHLIIISLFGFTLSACDSPMNNRVSDSGDTSGFDIEKKAFSSLEFQVEVKWLEGPFGNISKDNHLLVFLYKDEELVSLAENQTLAFYATMPSMGHPMEDAGYFEEIDKGIYLNKTIRFNMPGDWKNEIWIMDEDFNIMDRLEWLIFF